MFRVPIDGPAFMYRDNKAVFKNVSMPQSLLSKKHHSIAYHFCHEAVASGVVMISKEDSKTNLADLFTKPLMRDQREFLLNRFMY